MALKSLAESVLKSASKPTNKLPQRNEIHLSKNNVGWVATFVGPHSEKVLRLFGTVTIPTPFTLDALPKTVLETVANLNPGVVVSFLVTGLEG